MLIAVLSIFPAKIRKRRTTKIEKPVDTASVVAIAPEWSKMQ